MFAKYLRSSCWAHRPGRNWACLAALALALSPSQSQASYLFDGQLGTMPNSQGWPFVTDPLSGSLATQTASPGWTTLDTTARKSDSAGYPSFLHSGIGILDRDIGFILSIELKMLSESHSSSDRAGFSLIVITDDLQGIELGFWEDEIWAQEDLPLFTHAESASFQTTTDFVRYDVAITGSTYQLAADGSTILSGPLRDYSAFGFPYHVPNFVFFGDNTSSASTAVQIAKVELTSVPETSSILLACLGAALGFACFRPHSAPKQSSEHAKP